MATTDYFDCFVDALRISCSSKLERKMYVNKNWKLQAFLL